MQKRTLSLIIGSALIIPSLAMAAPSVSSNTTPAELRAEPAVNTIQAETKGPNGELVATQPGETVDETYPKVEATDAQNQAPFNGDLGQQDSSEIYPSVTEPTDTDEYAAAPTETDMPLTDDTLQEE